MYKDSLVDMRSQLLAALAKVEDEMEADEIPYSRASTRASRPASANVRSKTQGVLSPCVSLPCQVLISSESHSLFSQLHVRPHQA